MITTRTIPAVVLAAALTTVAGCGVRSDPAPSTAVAAPGAPGAGTGSGGGGDVTAPGTPIKVPPFVPKGTSYYGTAGGRTLLERLVRENCPDGSVCLKIVPVRTDTAGRVQCEMIALPDEGRFLPERSTLKVQLGTPCDPKAPQDVEINDSPSGTDDGGNDGTGNDTGGNDTGNDTGGNDTGNDTGGTDTGTGGTGGNQSGTTGT